MNKKFSLILSGDISSEEMKKAKKYFESDSVEVHEAFTKSIESPEIIQIIFKNFDAVELLRNGLLFKFLWESSNKVFNFVKKVFDNNKAPDSYMVQTIFKRKDKPTLSINIEIPKNEEKRKKVINEIRNKFTLDYLDSIEKQEVWVVGYKKDKEVITISEL